MTFFNRKYKYLLLIIALILFFYGIYIGEMEIILAKAINICLECCGIG